MKKWMGLLVLILMMGLVLVGCGKSTDTSGEPKEPAQTVNQDAQKDSTDEEAKSPVTPDPAKETTSEPEKPATDPKPADQNTTKDPANEPAKTATPAPSTPAPTVKSAPAPTPAPIPTPVPTPAPVSAPAPEPVQPKELIISAAASLKNAMGEITTAYAQKEPNVKLTFNFGSSGSLQQQIEQGAPADIFFSAGKSQVDNLENKSLLLEGTRSDLLLNELVLVVNNDNTTITSFDDLNKAEHIGIGTPESVPAGQYAKEALTSMKLWELLQPKFVQAKDVTQVLTYVESGNADAGFVYRSDSLSSTKVKVVAAAPADSHSKILYPAAVIKDSKNPAEAKAFLNYLKTPEAQAIFVKYGFKSGI